MYIFNVVVTVASLGLGIYLGARLLRWRRSLKLAELRERGQQGELDAERWLRENGFEIIDSQGTERFTYRVDDQAVEFRVRPDFMARFAGQRWLIEVKTGKSASPEHSATRRQIREYAQLWPRHRYALFDATNGVFSEVSFRSGRPRIKSLWDHCLQPIPLLMLGVGVICGLLIGAIIH